MFNMTKYLDYAFLSVALLAALPACTSESEDPDPINEVRFSAIENTRSTLLTNTSLTSFTIYGNMPSVVFDGAAVTKTDGNWRYDNVQYWFPGKTYSFAAIHLPSTDNISDLTYRDDKLTFNYTATSDYTNAPDILTAGHRRVYTNSTSSPATPVDLNFGHIMSRINFVANVESSAPIEINKITLSGIVSSASYTLQPAPLVGGAKQTSDLAGPTWTLPQNPTRITITKEFSDNPIAGGSSFVLFPADDPLLVIPQSVSTDINVELTYTTENGTQSVVTGRLRNSTSSHNYIWTAGRSYTYSFTLGADEYLLFDKPVAEAWNEGPGGSYYIID